MWLSKIEHLSTNAALIAQSLGNLKRYPFCLFVVVSQLLWRRVGWELPGYFRLIFHICITRFNNSVTHDIYKSVTVRFILWETTMAEYRILYCLLDPTIKIISPTDNKSTIYMGDTVYMI